MFAFVTALLFLYRLCWCFKFIFCCLLYNVCLRHINMSLLVCVISPRFFLCVTGILVLLAVYMFQSSMQCNIMYCVKFTYVNGYSCCNKSFEYVKYKQVYKCVCFKTANKNKKYLTKSFSEPITRLLLFNIIQYSLSTTVYFRRQDTGLLYRGSCL